MFLAITQLCRLAMQAGAIEALEDTKKCVAYFHCVFVSFVASWLPLQPSPRRIASRVNGVRR